jgi:hypothetical protein
MMHQRNRRLVLTLAASLLATVGVLAACTTDNGTTPLPGGGVDSGGGKDGAKSDGKVDEEEEDGGKPKDGGTTADCAAAKPRSNKGIFCFGGAGSNDAGQCDPTDDQVCCADEKVGMNFADPKCAPAGGCGFTPDAGGREWHCTEPSHCPGASPVCCVTKGWGGSPTTSPNTKDFPGCGVLFNGATDFFVGGSRCREDSCEAAELQLCSEDSECDSGQKCTLIKIANRFTGVCK